MSQSRFLSISILLCFAGVASGESAFTLRATNLRAGPSTGFEVVAQLPPGIPVTVAGCVNDFTWCDVILNEDRGWVYAGNLEYPYEDGRVSILTGGAYLGLPIVTFSIGPYWDTYYRARPWYGRRHYWEMHPLPPRHPWGYPPGFPPPGRRPLGFHPPGWHHGPADLHPYRGHGGPGDRHPPSGYRGHGDLHPPSGYRGHGDLHPPSGHHGKTDMRPPKGDRRPPLQPKRGAPRTSHDGSRRENRPR